MPFVKKYIYIIYFITLFLFKTIFNYFRNGNWALFDSFFYALLFVLFYAFATWAWDSKKYEKK